MTECPRCVVDGKRGDRWHANGQMATRSKGGKSYIIASLICDREGCGNVFATSTQDAIIAAEKAREAQGMPPYCLETGSTSMPRVPMKPGGFARVGSYGKTLLFDVKKRAGGDDE